jgi:hypothetical protein
VSGPGILALSGLGPGGRSALQVIERHLAQRARPLAADVHDPQPVERPISSRMESSDDSEIAVIQYSGAVDLMQSDHKPL